MSPYSDIWNEPDAIYFTLFQDIIPPPQAVAGRSQGQRGREEAIRSKQQALFYSELLKRLEELSRTQERMSTQAKPTASLYLGRRVKPEE